MENAEQWHHLRTPHNFETASERKIATRSATMISECQANNFNYKSKLKTLIIKLPHAIWFSSRRMSQGFYKLHCLHSERYL